MVDGAMRSDERGAHRDAKAELDERRIAHGVAIGLPAVTVTVAAIIGVTIGAPMAILVLAAGMLLGVIGLFWASLRILSGDAALSPELEALDASAHAVDALASRKKMLLRALKDLDNERALGKLEDDDHEQLSLVYRNELKEVLSRIDASLEPHRKKAEDAARTYLAKAGLVEEGYRGTQPVESDDDLDDDDDDDDDVVENAAPVTAAPAAPAKKPSVKKKVAAPATRVACPKCETSNEVDASFCKKCGASLAAKAESETASDAKETKDSKVSKDSKESDVDEA
jgi:hypothetical protein